MRRAIFSKMLIVGFVVFAVSIIFAPKNAHAIEENRVNVPQNIIDQMLSIGQTGVSGKKCGGFNNAQWHWISEDDDSRISRNLNNESVSISDAANSLALRMNIMGGYCDSIISPSTGKITNTSLARTGVTIAGSPSVSIDHPNVNTSSINISTNGLQSGNTVIQDYDTAIFFNQRFAKKLFPNNTIMENLKFSLQGLNSLPANDDEYVITIRIPVRQVNDFPDGYDAKNSAGSTVRSRFVCVRGQIATENIKGSNREACDTSELVLRVKIKVSPEYAGQCTIQNVAGAVIRPGTAVDLQPGQRFDASFKVTNTGSKTWSMFFAKMGSWDPRDNIRWGVQRFGIPTPYSNNGFPILANGQSTEWSTSGPTFTAPTQPGLYTFSWRILQEGGTGSGYPNKTNMGDCSTPVRVRVPENRPYISIGGGDVYSGAVFDDCSLVSDRVKDADINTNGYYGGTVSSGLGGSSYTQYGVFASGRIGQGGIGVNTFRGNYGYPFRNTDGSIITPDPANPLATTDRLQDALFANLNVGDYYGRFYQGQQDPAVPCIDTSNVEQAAGSSISAADASIFLASTESGARKVAGDLTIGALAIPVDTQKTLFIDGDLRLTGSIQYDSPYTLETIPSLKIIAHNIYIDSAVGQVDGHLVAKPTGASNQLDGLVDTCANYAGEGVWPATLAVDSCDSRLTINGSLTARRMLWKRTSGTLGLPGTLLDASCPFAKYGPDEPGPGPFIQSSNDAVVRHKLCAAEAIEFSPEAYLGELGGRPGSVPITTQELPPIY